MLKIGRPGALRGQTGFKPAIGYLSEKRSWQFVHHSPLNRLIVWRFIDADSAPAHGDAGFSLLSRK